MGCICSTTGSTVINSGSEQNSALKNELIMKNVARSLPAADLFHLRRTCHTWNTVFIEEIRRNPCRLAPIRFNWRRREESGGEIARFVRCMKSSRLIPFVSYHLTFEDSQDTAVWTKLAKFSRVCGPAVAALSIFSVSYSESGPPPFDMIGKIVFECCPNLTELRLFSGSGPSLTCTSFFQPRRRRPRSRVTYTPRELNTLKSLELDVWGTKSDPQELLKNLVQHTSQLVSLHVMDQAYYREAVEHLLKIPSLTCSSKLRTFTSNLESLADVQLLLNLNLSLRSLTICIQLKRFTNDQNCRPLLHQVLATQSPTLREMVLRLSGNVLDSAPDSVPLFSLAIPKMEKVRSLELDCDSFSWELYGGESMRGLFPGLRRLTVGSRVARTAEYSPISFLEPQGSHEHVTELTLRLSDTSWRTWSALFPSVTRLELKLPRGNDIAEPLSGLWTAWPLLRVLVVQHQGEQLLNLDGELTGVKDLNGVNNEVIHELSSQVVTMETLARLQQAYKTKPGLSDLTFLQEFRVELGYNTPVKLTELGGYLGFALSARTRGAGSDRCSHPHLVRICINCDSWTNDPNSKIQVSPNCKAFIQEALGFFATVDF